MRHLLLRPLILLLLGNLSLPGAAVTPEVLLQGAWENRTQGDLVGLRLLAGDTCEIYLERALQQRVTHSCRYAAAGQMETQERFEIFLKDADGQCDTTPDFEFIFEPALPLIRLQTGGGGEVALQKVSPAP